MDDTGIFCLTFDHVTNGMNEIEGLEVVTDGKEHSSPVANNSNENSTNNSSS